MPKEAPRCIIMEDEDEFFVRIQNALELGGWEIIGVARSRSAADRLTAKKKLKPHVVFLDANLMTGDTSCRDGWELASRLERAGAFLLPYTRSPEKSAWGDAPGTKNAQEIVARAEQLVHGELPGASNDVF